MRSTNNLSIALEKKNMNNDDLPQTLEKLHLDLAKNPQLDEKTSQSLRSLIEEIQLVLARSGSDQPTELPSGPTLSERVSDLVADFEMRHPKLTTTLATIAERLSDMGI
jgi:hypothetical protein